MHGLAAHRVALEVLDEHRRARAAVDRDLEDRAGVRQRVAQDARVDGEVLRLAVAAVDDAGDEALAAQAARGARALRVAGGQGERSGVGSHGEGVAARDGRVRNGARAARHASETGSARAPRQGSLAVMSPDEELMLIFGALHLVALALGVLLFVLFLRSDTGDGDEEPRGGRGRRRGRQRPHLRRAEDLARRRHPAPGRRAGARPPARPRAARRPAAAAERRRVAEPNAPARASRSR